MDFLDQFKTGLRMSHGMQRGQIGTLIIGLIFVLVGMIVAVALQQIVVSSAENFTNGTIQRLIFNNIMPMVLLGLFVGVVGLFVGLRLSK